MAKPLKQWIDEDLPALENIPREQMDTKEFFREPIIPHWINSDIFFSPASGTILYQKEVEPDEEIIEIKGNNFTLKNLMQNDSFNQKCLVIGIFLSQYDIHTMYLPTSGIVKYNRLDKLTTKNKPMLNEETDILSGLIKYSDMEYAFTNERYLYEIHDLLHDYKYYMVAIADEDVDVIANFYDSGKYISQNCKIASIRWGSQCDLILPLPINYELIQPNYYHIEAAYDPLIKRS